MSSIARNSTGRENSAKVDSGKEVIYPGTLVWNASAMGEHKITDVQSTTFLFRITGPALTEEQVCELSRRAMPYHLRRKEQAQAQIAKQIQEGKAEETRKKAEYRRLHRKTYVKATVNAYLKRQFKDYHERQQADHASGEEWDDEDNTNVVVGERDDDWRDVLLDYDWLTGPTVGSLVISYRCPRFHVEEVSPWAWNLVLRPSSAIPQPQLPSFPDSVLAGKTLSMPPSATQRHVISQFMSITGAQERVAQTFCKKYSWKLDQSCDAYFAQNPIASPAVSEKVDASLTKMFEKYRDTKNDEKDTVGIDGTMTYLAELAVDFQNASSLIPLEITQAPALGEMGKEEFVNGWKKVAGKTAVDTIPKQKSYIATQTALLSSDMNLFKRVYKHTFICSKEKGQKAMPLENAIIYWQMLFSPPGMKWVTSTTNWLDLWVDFLQKNWTKSVNKDMWNQTFEFFLKTMQDESLSFWSEDGAWPSVIDDFVAHVKNLRGPQVPDKMETD